MNLMLWPWLCIKWCLLGCLSIPMTVLAKLICWLLPLFVDKRTAKLPWWLAWFDTPNSTADGDPAHQLRHPGADRWAVYKRRTSWYWRNSAYGFDRIVCGVEAYSSDTMKVMGRDDAGRRPYKPGTCLRLLYDDNRRAKAWFLYFAWSWPFGLFESRCIRGSIGWKLWCKKEKGYGTAMWTGMINPFFHRD